MKKNVSLLDPFFGNAYQILNQPLLTDIILTILIIVE